MELVTQRYLNTKTASRDVDMSSFVELIMDDEDVLFSWSIASVSWDHETAEVLLRLIAKYYVTM